MAMTPEQWLPVLAQSLDERRPRLAGNRRYANGDAPLPEMGRNTRASWLAFQKKARTNLGGLTCQSLAGRIVPLGVRVGAGDNESVRAARKVWRDNRLDVVFADAIWNMLSTSWGYLLTERSASGSPVITSEPPETMITEPDPVQPWRSQAALKTWRDKRSGRDYATVWTPGLWQTFVRSSHNTLGTPRPTAAEGWEAATPPQRFEGGVPVHVLVNAHGVAEFEPHIDVIDRINLGKLNRLVVTAMQAFKQRALKGGLPDDDGDGNDPDWAKLFEPAPGALWDLPDGIDIWESAPVDIRPLLEGEKADARDFAAVTQTPISVFIPDSQNQSAEGAMNSKEGEIGKASNRIAIAKVAFEGAILEALRILGADDGETVEVQFSPPAYISYEEKANAAKLAKGSGQSTRWIARNIWGMSPDEISEMETDLALEQLSLLGAASGDAA